MWSACGPAAANKSINKDDYDQGPCGSFVVSGHGFRWRKSQASTAACYLSVGVFLVGRGYGLVHYMQASQKIKYAVKSGMLGGVLSGSMAGLVLTTYFVVWVYLTESLVWTVFVTISGALLGLILMNSRALITWHNLAPKHILGMLTGFLFTFIVVVPLRYPSPLLSEEGIISAYLGVGVLLLYGLISGLIIGTIAGGILAFFAAILIRGELLKQRWMGIISGAAIGFVILSPSLLSLNESTRSSFTNISLGLALGVLCGGVGGLIATNNYLKNGIINRRW